MARPIMDPDHPEYANDDDGMPGQDAPDAMTHAPDFGRYDLASNRVLCTRCQRMIDLYGWLEPCEPAARSVGNCGMAHSAGTQSH